MLQTDAEASRRVADQTTRVKVAVLLVVFSPCEQTLKDASLCVGTTVESSSAAELSCLDRLLCGGGAVLPPWC